MSDSKKSTTVWGRKLTWYFPNSSSYVSKCVLWVSHFTNTELSRGEHGSSETLWSANKGYHSVPHSSTIMGDSQTHSRMELPKGEAALGPRKPFQKPLPQAKELHARKLVVLVLETNIELASLLI